MSLTVSPDEIEFVAIRAQGPGGQNVNKVSSAVQLRFNVPASSLPEAVKERLLALAGSRASREGVIVIKAQTSRSQEENLWRPSRGSRRWCRRRRMCRRRGDRRGRRAARSSAACRRSRSARK